MIKFLKNINNVPIYFINIKYKVLANITNNKIFMNIKNKSNVGNTSFIPMNKYMLSPGSNNNRCNQRLALYNSLIFSNFYIIN